MSEEERIQKKGQVVEYLRHFPFYKWAAKSAGIDEDTLKLWRDDDKEFSDRCEIAKSESIAQFGKRATPDFILKSADPESFKERKELEITGESLVIIKEKDGNTTQPVADGSMERPA